MTPTQLAQAEASASQSGGEAGGRISFFSDAFSRASGLPDGRLVNLISEATPFREERPYEPLVALREIHYSRPGLVTGYTFGTGTVRGLTQAPPALGAGLIIVVGTTAYSQAGANLGTVGGTDMVRWATSRGQLIAVGGGTAYLYTGTTFAPIVSAGLPPVSDVAFLGGRFVYAAVGSDTFYYSEINDAANVKGLNFETAETLPDQTAGIAVLNDELVVFGKQSVQFFSTSIDPAAPYAPVLGRGFQRGCEARDTIRYADNALFWVGDNRVVYRSKQVPERVSSNSIEGKLRQCADISRCTAFAATFEGHEFYVLNIHGVGSYAYDASRVGAQAGGYGDSYARGEWGEWQSYGKAQFRARCSTVVADVTYVGDDTTNDVWVMTPGVYTDAGGTMTRTASAFIKVESGFPRCNSLVLHCVTGVGNPVAPGVVPIVEMRHSDDQGRTFGPWRGANLGSQGVYTGRAVWQQLGQMRAPGRLIEVRCSDPVNVVLSHLEMNSPRPTN